MILIELTAAKDAAGTLQTFYVSTGNFVTVPTDTPANTAFLPVVTDAGSIGIHAYSNGKTGGATKLETGEIILANADGALDSWLNYSFDGRTVTIRSGTSGAYPANFPVVMTGTVESLEATWKTIVIRLRDRQFVFGKPVLTTRYAGTNAGAVGLEGTANDIKGKVKPRIYGKVRNVSPDPANSSSLIYQVSDGVLASIDAVNVRGAALTAGGARRLATIGVAQTTVNFTVSTTTVTTASAHGYTTGDPASVATSGTLPTPLAITSPYFARSLSATTLSLHNTQADANAGVNAISMSGGTGTHNISNTRAAQGCYDWCFDATGSFIQLGTAPTGQITVDATQGSTAANRTTAQILKQLALDAGLSSGEISAPDVTTLDAANSAVVGIFITDESTTFQQAMDAIGASAGAWYGFDGANTMRMGTLSEPTGTPVLTVYSFDQGVDTERTVPADGGIPTYRVTVNHTKIWTVQASDLAGSVSTATLAFLAEERRSEKAEDTSIKTQWRLAPELDVDTLLTSATDAATEAARLLALYKVRRDVFDVPVSLALLTSVTLKLMDVVALQVGRFGMSGSKSFRLIGIRYELAHSRAILTLWG